jgi:hypothetical protein
MHRSLESDTGEHDTRWSLDAQSPVPVSIQEEHHLGFDSMTKRSSLWSKVEVVGVRTK